MQLSPNRKREEGFEITYSDSNRTVKCRFRLWRFDLGCLAVIGLSVVVSLVWAGLSGADGTSLIKALRLFAELR